MRVLVCGSRSWDDEAVITTFLEGAGMMSASVNEKLVVIEGAARGADHAAGDWARRVGDRYVDLEEYPADWEAHGRAAGPIRNKQMLDEGKPDVVLAFSDDIENSRGTKHMVQLAKRAGVPVYVVSRA